MCRLTRGSEKAEEASQRERGIERGRGNGVNERERWKTGVEDGKGEIETRDEVRSSRGTRA